MKSRIFLTFLLSTTAFALPQAGSTTLHQLLARQDDQIRCRIVHATGTKNAIITGPGSCPYGPTGSQLKTALKQECFAAESELATDLQSQNGHWVFTFKAPPNYECIHNAIYQASGGTVNVDCADHSLKKTKQRPATASDSDEEY